MESRIVLALVVLVGLVLQARGGKIYFPTDLQQIRLDIAIRKCIESPTCDLPPHLATGDRCKDDDLKNAFEAMKASGATGEGGVCNGVAGEVKWPSTGECVTLLTQGLCSPGEWVVLEAGTNEPVCRPQPCEALGGGPGVLVEGECYPPSELPPTFQCPTNQEGVTNKHGELECDCPVGLIYFPDDEACYTPYSEGPCAPGWIIKVENTEGGTAGVAKCFPNECPNPGMVSMEKDTCRLALESNAQSQCYLIDTQGPCINRNNLTIDPGLAQPICLSTQTIFEKVVCPPGSLLDLKGLCRTQFDAIMSEIPLITTRSHTVRTGSRGVCAPDEYFAAGACIKIRD